MKRQKQTYRRVTGKGIAVTVAMNDNPKPGLDWGLHCIVAIAGSLDDPVDADHGSDMQKPARLALEQLTEAKTVEVAHRIAVSIPEKLRFYINSRLLDRIVYIALHLSTPRRSLYQGPAGGPFEIHRFLNPTELSAALGWLDALAFYARLAPATQWTASLARLYHRSQVVDYLRTHGVDAVSFPLQERSIQTVVVEKRIDRDSDFILSLEAVDPSVEITVTDSNSGLFSFRFQGKYVFDPPYPIYVSPLARLVVSSPVRVQRAFCRFAGAKDDPWKTLVEEASRGGIGTLQCVGNHVFGFNLGVPWAYFFDNEDDVLCLYRQITFFNRQGPWVENDADVAELRRIL